MIAARRVIERRAHDLQQGTPPTAAQLHDRYGVRPLDVISPHNNLGDLLADHVQETRMTAVAAE